MTKKANTATTPEPTNIFFRVTIGVRLQANLNILDHRPAPVTAELERQRERAGFGASAGVRLTWA